MLNIKKLLLQILKVLNTIPIGQIEMYGGGTEPTGWLFCDGRAVSRTTYSKLFAVIGDKFGSGDGSTTFNLPDFRDKMPIGAGNDYLLNAEGGNKQSSLIEHNHSISLTSGSGTSHYHGHGNITGKTTEMSASNSNYITSTTAVSTHAVATNSLPDSTTYRLLRAAYANNTVGKSAPTIAAGKTVTISGNTDTEAGHTHSVSGNTGNKGATNTAESNMPPYRAINFMIYAGV